MTNIQWLGSSPVKYFIFQMKKKKRIIHWHIIFKLNKCITCNTLRLQPNDETLILNWKNVLPKKCFLQKFTQYINNVKLIRKLNIILNVAIIKII